MNNRLTNLNKGDHPLLYYMYQYPTHSLINIKHFLQNLFTLDVTKLKFVAKGYYKQKIYTRIKRNYFSI
jgi:hypothetical protein